MKTLHVFTQNSELRTHYSLLTTHSLRPSLFLMMVGLFWMMTACEDRDGLASDTTLEQQEAATFRTDDEELYCGPDTTKEDCSGISTHIDTIIVPGIGCPSIVQYDFRECSEVVGNIYRLVYEVFNMKILHIYDPNVLIAVGTTCDRFLNYINHLDTMNNDSIAEAYFNNVYNHYYEEITDVLIEDRLESIPDLTICGAVHDNFIVNFYVNSCYKICLSRPPLGVPHWSKALCGLGCCVRTTEFCLDPVTGEEHRTITIDGADEVCELTISIPCLGTSFSCFQACHPGEVELGPIVIDVPGDE